MQVYHADDNVGMKRKIQARLCAVIAFFFVLMSIFPLYARAVDVVVDDIQKIEVTPSTSSLAEGQSLTLKAFFVYVSGKREAAKNITWKLENQEDADYLEVGEKSGKVTALSNKAAPLTSDKTINVKAYYKKLNRDGLEEEIASDSIPIIVKPKAVTAVSISTRMLSLQVGEEKPISVTATYNDGKTVLIKPEELEDETKWLISSSDSNIVTLEKGKVKALGSSTELQTITIQSATDATKKAVVYVETYKIDKIEISPEQPALIKGQTTTLKATFAYSNGKKGTAREIVWKSSNEEIATVDEKTGKVTAVAPGSVDITATYKLTIGETTQEFTGTVTVTVIDKEITQLTSSPSALSLIVGETKQVKLTMTENNGKKTTVTGPITWTVKQGNSDLVKIVNGNITAVATDKDGNTPIRSFLVLQAAYEYKPGSVRTVDIPVTINDVKAIEITPISLSLIEGQSTSLKAMLLYTDGTRASAGNNIRWGYNSSGGDEEFFTLDQTGKVSAIKSTGDAQREIRAIYVKNEQLSGISYIKVLPKSPARITLSPSTLSMKVGETKQLSVTFTYNDGKTAKGQPTRWEVEQEGYAGPNDSLPEADKVASVDSTGKIAATKQGKAKVTAVFDDGAGKILRATIPVVVSGVTKIELSPSAFSMVQGQTTTLKATIVYSDGKRVPVPNGAQWVSDAPGVAGVDNKGQVSAISPGTAAIRVNYQGLPSETAQIVVSGRKMIGISVLPGAIALKAGEAKPIKLLAVYNDGTKENIPPENWGLSSSSSSSVAQIVNGSVVALAEGSASLDITYNGMSTSIFVQVERIPTVTRIEVAPSSINVFEGQQAQLRTYLVYSDGRKKAAPLTMVSYQTENAAIASVALDGKVVTGVAGNTTITVKYEGFEATVPVTVIQKKVTSLTVSPGSLTLLVGETKALKATITKSDGKKENASNVRWESNDTSIADVHPVTGMVKAKSRGSTFITAHFVGEKGEVLDTTIPVLVDGIVGLDISPMELSLIEGQKGSLKASLVYSNGKQISVSEGLIWSTTSPDVIAVDSRTGEVQAKEIFGEEVIANVDVQMTPQLAEKYPLDPGIEAITIRGSGKVRVSAKKVVSLVFTPQSMSLVVGEKKPITLQAVYNDKTKKDVTKEVTWRFNPPEAKDTIIAIVEEDNQIKIQALATGKAVIEAEFEGLMAVMGANNAASSNASLGSSTMSAATQNASNASIADQNATNVSATDQNVSNMSAAGQDVSLNKEWSIRFNKELDPSTVNEKTVIVTDENNREIAVEVSLVQGDTIRVVNPAGYEPGKQYFIIVKRNIRSKDGLQLRESIRMPFVINE